MILEQILKEKGREVYSVAESASLKEAAELLDTRKVGAMVILNEAGGVIGVISERDIVRAMARSGASSLNHPVSDAMSRQVVTARPKETIEAAMDRMSREIAAVNKLTLTEAIKLIHKNLAKSPRRTPKTEENATEADA